MGRVSFVLISIVLTRPLEYVYFALKLIIITAFWRDMFPWRLLNGADSLANLRLDLSSLSGSRSRNDAAAATSSPATRSSNNSNRSTGGALQSPLLLELSDPTLSSNKKSSSSYSNSTTNASASASGAGGRAQTQQSAAVGLSSGGSTRLASSSSALTGGVSLDTALLGGGRSSSSSASRSAVAPDFGSFDSNLLTAVSSPSRVSAYYSSQNSPKPKTHSTTGPSRLNNNN